MRRPHTSLSAFGCSAGDPLVPDTFTDSECRQMEAWFIGRVVSALDSRCSPLGLRDIRVEGSSERGWVVTAKLGDGRPVSTELEMNDILGVPAGDDWVDRVLALFSLRLEAAADLVLHPPEPSGDGPIMGLDSVGVQLGVEILDKLGESGLERIRGVLTGEDVHDPVGPVREFVPASVPERKDPSDVGR